MFLSKDVYKGQLIQEYKKCFQTKLCQECHETELKDQDGEISTGPGIEPETSLYQVDSQV